MTAPSLEARVAAGEERLGVLNELVIALEERVYALETKNTTKARLEARVKSYHQREERYTRTTQPPPGKDAFPQRLRFLREGVGLSLRELEILTDGDCTHRTIWSWETGSVKEPRLGPGLRSVAAALGVSPGYLLDGD